MGRARSAVAPLAPSWDNATQHAIELLMVPLALVPAQWRDLCRASQWSPEQRLAARMLRQAAEDWRRRGCLAEQVLSWLDGTVAANWPFGEVCEALGLEPNWVRRLLLRPRHLAYPRRGYCHRPDGLHLNGNGLQRRFAPQPAPCPTLAPENLGSPARMAGAGVF